MIALESFIPFPRHILLEACLTELETTATDVQAFSDFCQSLSLFYHLRYHKSTESLKAQYLPFDPEEVDYGEGDLNTGADFIAQFSQILEEANFSSLSKDTLKKAFATESLISLKTDVDFDDFIEVVCYCQGDIFQEVKTKKIFREFNKKVDIYERVVLLVQFKSADYFKQKKIDVKKLPFKPGKIYISMYKNIPKKDIEFVFPNVEVGMLLRDKLLFWIPAIAAGVPTVFKIIPQFTLIIGVILFVVFGYFHIDWNFVQIQSEEAKDVMPILVAMLSVLLGCGGFAARQYATYKFKYLKFQKEVTDTLFFRNLSNQFGVVQLLVDAAEEEECKEIFLVYCFLLKHGKPLDAKTLDQEIETWFLEKWNSALNFDIVNTLKVMENFAGDRPLVTKTEDGRYVAMPIEESKTLLQKLLQESV
ncbi:hypothetical protein Lepto7376_0355 [[Leptolyngbya] sp. PCC 7376]|nr:hypothetical protein Lepto7376_0355 [[Leptolyngbya] sp. PCC 7376]